MPVGTLVIPAPADVRYPVMYGADGTEYTGTLEAPPSLSAVGSGNADRLLELVRRRLDPEMGGALPAGWWVRARKDSQPLAADQYPACLVVAGLARLLEFETDNRVLVGYVFHVGLLVREAAVNRTDPPLAALRRVAMQTVTTTTYPGVTVESLDLEEPAGVPWPGLDEGVTNTGFTLVVGVCENLGPTVEGEPTL